jgi:hypothetical protein
VIAFSESPEGFPFRIIANKAFFDLIDRRCPEKLNEIMKFIKQKKSLKKEGIAFIKEKTNGKISGEDAIEKAVKRIYEAIYRKPYPSKRKHDLFCCPIHGDSCYPDCSNYKKYMRIFNARYQLRPLYTSANIDLLEDPKGIKKPAVGKATKIKGIQAKQE